MKDGLRLFITLTPHPTHSDRFLVLFFGSGSSLGKLGIVSELTLPHEDFIQSERELQEKGAEVERIVWPDELRRYSVHEVMGNFTNTLFFVLNIISLIRKFQYQIRYYAEYIQAVPASI